MKLLMHICCVPCAIYPIKLAKYDGYEKIGSLFYNPNIHPTKEYEKRRKEIKFLVESEDLAALDAGYDPGEYFKTIKDFDDASKRCESCWMLRIEKTAQTAEREGFDAFSTTLLASPYQNHAAVKEMCRKYSESYNVKFYYKDFRIGFNEAHNEARKRSIYCQNYCGCVFSLVEREEVRMKKKIK